MFSPIARTQNFTIENHNVLVQMVSQASWPPELAADSLEIWESGPPKTKNKEEIHRMQIRPAQNVCGVFTRETPGETNAEHCHIFWLFSLVVQ